MADERSRRGKLCGISVSPGSHGRIASSRCKDHQGVQVHGRSAGNLSVRARHSRPDDCIGTRAVAAVCGKSGASAGAHGRKGPASRQRARGLPSLALPSENRKLNNYA
ncbi:uncharacterized protein LOC112341367 isoform X1 [Selaginella moellendorffii]|uniref:uncharacterized protein LOC112341367 isoform X1 n=1 Tax=Selaginella moellendorffii TaxID=88036 RepID=UPI000D1C519C|nr:uncharacterized protein LOC112341367 isoform X1 [Selaginella moellendorffii]|eukprot:XP_024517081.1 uncharacterized protein LOC112341367 isoform X1 [Selaginella moellendorffii]